MSAFVVSEETMTRAVRGLLALHYGHPITAEIGRIKTDSRDAGSLIGRALFALNAEAVAQRYDEEPDEDTADLSRNFVYLARLVPQTIAQLVDSFKALQCLAYQCREGHCDKTPLYSELQQAIAALAVVIVGKLPNYSTAAWD